MLLPRCQDGGFLFLLLALGVDSTHPRRSAFHRHRGSSAASSSYILSYNNDRRLSKPWHHEAFGLIRFVPSGLNAELLSVAKLRGGSGVGDVGYVSDDEKDEASGDAAEDEEESDDKESEVESNVVETDRVRSSSKPVAVTIRSSTGSKLLDQTVELPTVNRNRNVASLKQSVSRQLPSRPPVSAIQLILHGKIIDDDTTVDDLIGDEDDDEDEEDDETDTSDGLVLQLDMLPTADTKFLFELEKKFPDLTTAELLEAYAVNEAAVYHNSALLMKAEQQQISSNEEENGDEGAGKEQRQQTAPQPVNIQIREHAARIRQDLESSILKTDHAQQLLADPLPPSTRQAIAAVEVKGQRVRRPGTTGVKGNWKRALQHNLNVDWAATLRHVALFLFFGYFGGRTTTSRAILLLGAPSVFLLQLRPVKLLLRQAIFAILDHPPPIVLSLLPAPQQTILSLNVQQAMETVYGSYIKRNLPFVEELNDGTADVDDAEGEESEEEQADSEEETSEDSDDE